MSLFAINAAALNDSNEVWSWYGSAEMAAATELAPALRLVPSLDAAVIQGEIGGEAIYGRAAEGDALIALQADGEGTRWAFGSSDALLEFEVTGDGLVSGAGGGYFPIRFDGAMIPHVAASGMLAGAVTVEVQSSVTSRRAVPIRLEAASAINLAANGAGFLIMDAPGMSAAVGVLAEGAGRLGGKLYGEGNATIEVYSRGALGLRRYVYAEGSAKIQIQVRTEKAGIPPIPDTYIAAPAIRSLQVKNEPRLFTVPAERRL